MLFKSFICNYRKQRTGRQHASLKPSVYPQGVMLQMLLRTRAWHTPETRGTLCSSTSRRYSRPTGKNDPFSRHIFLSRCSDGIVEVSCTKRKNHKTSYLSKHLRQRSQRSRLNTSASFKDETSVRPHRNSFLFII